MLREDFLPDYGLTTASLASAVGVSRQTINEVLRERRSVTPAMALRFSRPFGNSAKFWLQAQHARDLWESEERYRKDLDKIHPLDVV
jgi:addiction module HigA family antidote